MKNLLHSFSRNQTRVGKRKAKGVEGIWEGTKNREHTSKDGTWEKKSKTKQPYVCFLPYRWAPVSSLWDTIPLGYPRKRVHSRMWLFPLQLLWHPSEASEDQLLVLCERKETARNYSFCNSKRIQTDSVINPYGCFLQEERSHRTGHYFSSHVHMAAGAEKGRAGGQRVGIRRGPFVLIYKVSEKFVLHLSLCQASSSSCYIRYVTSKITKTLIGRGQGPLNHIACP